MNPLKNNIDSLQSEIRESFNQDVQRAIEDKVVTEKEVLDIVTRYNLDKNEVINHTKVELDKFRSEFGNSKTYEQVFSV
ncbi:MAG: hypothetical protein LBQ59_03640 [Candidatus Peribacteria bacterium]|jgi:hypothetical protein|nr:hypothetical protein [Candidatus Peribacteria bacterium]